MMQVGDITYITNFMIYTDQLWSNMGERTVAEEIQLRIRRA